jgi:lipopolysaccharide transport system permease protein
LSEASNSLVANTNLVGKVYFPRIIIPSATAVVALVDLAINFVMLVGLMIWFAYLPSWRAVFLPLFVVLALCASLGPSLVMTALNVKYRDFRYIIPFIVQFGVYISPVGFSSAIVPEKWRFWFALNPIVGPIDGFRWCLLGAPLDLREFAISCAVIAILLWLGIAYFRRTERSFADII